MPHKSLPSLTDCGLAGIRDIPYGAHMCHFYEGRGDLAALLVPYFAAGLRSNERCIWIAAEPLCAAEVTLELRKAYVDVEAAVRGGALVIRDHSQWYVEAGNLKGTELADLWLAEEQRALADGYYGLRITGNVTFLTPQTWDAFMEYEEHVNEAFHGRRILALCTYRAAGNAAGLLDVARRHTCALDQPDEGWQITTRA